MNIETIRSIALRTRNWKRKKELYLDYVYHCDYWHTFSKDFLRLFSKCRCGDKATVCHHLTYKHVFYERDYPEDIEPLCKTCHMKIHDIEC